MPFKKGQSGNPKGKRVGTKHKLTQEARELAQSLLTEAYRERLKDRLLEGKAGIIEAKVWEYAFGKPTDTVDMRLTGQATHIHEHYWTDNPAQAST